MTETAREKEVAERVKKLLALSKSSNIHEAQLAAEKAREYLTKYGMTLTDVEIQTADMIRDEVRTPYHSPGWENQYRKTINLWQSRLFGVMIRYYFIHVVTDNQGTAYFMGARTDVEVARYVYLYLCNEIFRLADVYLATEKRERPYLNQGELKKLRMAFSVGAVEGLRELHAEMSKKEHAVTATGTDLMVIKNAAAKQFSLSQFPNQRSVSRSTSGLDNRAIGAGIEAGKGITIRHGVGGKQGGQKAIRN